MMMMMNDDNDHDDDHSNCCKSVGTFGDAKKLFVVPRGGKGKLCGTSKVMDSYFVFSATLVALQIIHVSDGVGWWVKIFGLV